MDKEQIQEIILRVLSESREVTGAELPLEFPVEVSAKHVHLTEEAIEQLFGPGAALTPKRPLSQPGQFLSEERVTLVTPKGRIENVAVLGPARPAVQVELSVTDCRSLGITAPLRMSGDLSGAAEVYLLGPKGMICAKQSVIVAKAHLHITPPQAEPLGIADGQRVSVTIESERSMTLENVICRVSSQAALALHIDYDEANACMLPKNAMARMRVKAAEGAANGQAAKAPGAGSASAAANMLGAGDASVAASVLGSGGASIATGSQTANGVLKCDRKPVSGFAGKLITEAVARQLTAGNPSSLELEKGVIVTPSAKDLLRHAGVELIWKIRR